MGHQKIGGLISRTKLAWTDNDVLAKDGVDLPHRGYDYS